MKLPQGLKVIGNGAFWGCKSLERIIFFSTLTEIGMFAFNGCTLLREVKLCEGNQTIETGVFYLCRSLLHVEIPSTVTKISECAFADCTALREVKLCEGTHATIIGESAFRGCHSLLHINIPSTVTEMDEDAFYDCDLLRNIVISSNFSQEMFLGIDSLLSLLIKEMYQEPTSFYNVSSSLPNTDCSLEKLKG